jgi:hypothetical protein
MATSETMTPEELAKMKVDMIDEVTTLSRDILAEKIGGINDDAALESSRKELINFIYESSESFDGDWEVAWKALRQTIIQKWVASLTETPTVSASAAIPEPAAKSPEATPAETLDVDAQKKRITDWLRRLRYPNPEWQSIIGIGDHAFGFFKNRDELINFVNKAPEGFDGDVKRAWMAMIIDEQKDKIKDEFSNLHLVTYGLLTDVWEWPAIEKIKQDFFDYVDQLPDKSCNGCWKDAWNDFYKNNNEKIELMKEELKNQNKDFFPYRDDLAYIPRNLDRTIMNPAEKVFFKLLLKALHNKLIFPQVSMMAIISHEQEYSYKNGNKKWHIKTFICDNPKANIYCNKYNMMRTDYVICNSNFKIESLIELDGSGHDETYQKNKDMERDFMTYKAKFTTVRIPCTYDEENEKLKIYKDSNKKEEIKTDDDLRAVVLDFVPMKDEIAGIQTIYPQKRLPAIS